MKKKTLTEIYRECKHEQEIKQQLEYLRETTELFRKQTAESFINDLIRLCSPPPVPPIPQSFQDKV